MEKKKPANGEFQIFEANVLLVHRISLASRDKTKITK